MTNPYQTPEGQLTDDDQAYGEIKFFSPSSRINRLRYWAHSMLFGIVFMALLGAAVMLGIFVSPIAGFVVGIPVYVAAIVYSFILIIQRMHDLNKSGWMSLLILVPFANIYLLVLIIFFKGTQGRNNYGLQTPPNKTWHWVLALMIPVLIVLSIMAGIVMPSVIERLDAGKATGYENSAEYPSEYTDESAYPAEASDYAEENSASESMMEDASAEEALTDDNAEVIDEESAIMDEAESETLE